jgi:hypothetical protein
MECGRLRLLFLGKGRPPLPEALKRARGVVLCRIPFSVFHSTEAYCRSAVQLDKRKKSSRKRPHSILSQWEKCILNCGELYLVRSFPTVRQWRRSGSSGEAGWEIRSWSFHILARRAAT